ncbi:hypothetical protein ERJ75_000324700 [Trypanosoma vivax]|nr:hypothetical protein TRVL_06547 [Trypanosoma vivax]KAH8618006.1 hypothetical protein ERJ75_000324300 [Trypanosoma vivax]KAH8618014.1 hypothetical protein ERJ75_000324700 [Trypanosoma vivax]
MNSEDSSAADQHVTLASCICNKAWHCRWLLRCKPTLHPHREEPLRHQPREKPQHWERAIGMGCLSQNGERLENDRASVFVLDTAQKVKGEADVWLAEAAARTNSGIYWCERRACASRPRHDSGTEADG